jgi:hypothetical protein
MKPTDLNKHADEKKQYNMVKEMSPNFIDLSKLEKHVKGKVPDNIGAASQTFEPIIDSLDPNYMQSSKKTKANLIWKQLEHLSIKFPTKAPANAACDIAGYS